MGALFYRGRDPSNMGYADLRYWHRWHTIIADEELSAATRAAAKRAAERK